MVIMVVVVWLVVGELIIVMRVTDQAPASANLG